MQTLDQEQFDAVKELSQIQMAIAEGRSTLLKLRSEVEEYMKLREVDAEERVLRVLKESQESLQKISHNHQELSSYGSELKAYATELNGFANTLHTLFQDFGERMQVADRDMEVQRKDVAEVLRQTKIAQVSIDEDRKQLVRERQKTNEGMKLLDSQRAALQTAWDHLKK